MTQTPAVCYNEENDSAPDIEKEAAVMRFQHVHLYVKTYSMSIDFVEYFANKSILSIYCILCCTRCRIALPQYCDEWLKQMKHIFIINPAAGKKAFAEKIRERISAAAKKCGVDFSVIVTKLPSEATRIVNEIAENATERIRFYACGGDGTLNEVVNGMAAYANTECALYPAGTGNDFSRNFTSPENFLDLEKQINGKAERIDTVLCNGRHCINMVNIGFDCDVVAAADKIKKTTFFRGSFAYLVGVLLTLFKRYGTKMHITLKDGTELRDTYLLSAIANGGYCGGGFHSHPRTVLDDGLFDLCLIDKVSRFTFLRLLSSYRKGTHLDSPLGKNIIRYMQTDALSIKFHEPVGICMDGEIVYDDHADFSIMHDAIAFSVPVGSSPIPALMKKSAIPAT